MNEILGHKLTPAQARFIAAIDRPGGEDEGNIGIRLKWSTHVTRRIANRLLELGLISYGWRGLSSGYHLSEAAKQAIEKRARP